MSKEPKPKSQSVRDKDIFLFRPELHSIDVIDGDAEQPVSRWVKANTVLNGVAVVAGVTTVVVQVTGFSLSRRW